MKVAICLSMTVFGVPSARAGAGMRAIRPPAPTIAPDDLPPPMLDGRMLGHLQYPEVRREDLVAAPPGFAIGPVCLLRRGAAADLARMLAAAAAAPDVGKSLRGVSCFRSVARQRAVFCRSAPHGRCTDPARRARVVGPPGYSEHATGYAIDFGARPSPACSDVDACLARLPAGRWLLAHATEFGFELSFPAGNSQGVTWEPWHWRWVGATIGTPGAAPSRLVFARARAAYPASPDIPNEPDDRLPGTGVATPVPPPPASPANALPPVPVTIPPGQ